jgi:hypothetical protein
MARRHVQWDVAQSEMARGVGEVRRGTGRSRQTATSPTGWPSSNRSSFSKRVLIVEDESGPAALVAPAWRRPRGLRGLHAWYPRTRSLGRMPVVEEDENEQSEGEEGGETRSDVSAVRMLRSNPSTAVRWKTHLATSEARRRGALAFATPRADLGLCAPRSHPPRHCGRGRPAQGRWAHSLRPLQMMRTGRMNFPGGMGGRSRLPPLRFAGGRGSCAIAEPEGIGSVAGFRMPRLPSDALVVHKRNDPWQVVNRSLPNRWPPFAPWPFADTIPFELEADPRDDFHRIAPEDFAKILRGEIQDCPICVLDARSVPEYSAG